jgi:predicted nucleic acid-binding protein
MPFVLDASATAAWCFPDENALADNAAIDRLAHENALVPALWWAEVRNVLIVGERRGRIDAIGTARFLADLQRLRIQIDRNPTSDLVLALARRHRLTAYDAIYLELAGRFGIPLATLDARLAGAARAEGIPLLGMQQ